MADKFSIVEMKLDGGSWRVKFSGVTNAAGIGGVGVNIEPEEFRGPEIGMHTKTPQEVIVEAHKELANEVQRVFRAAVMSIPGVDWEIARNLTVSEILRDLGLDAGA
ncbi:hypothetical protein [Shinella zoogloeoides]|uniref:hypothetical protein n=1 Tax=Shinella zoogloeoides TaxID=352475 RepID=UPI00299D2AA1|nr:hypothetical protein [Shinella zoogloeoides]WPE22459.1 hypothetical protein ShzoTeo12_36750 [Shinella zoogloeoides]